MRRCRTLVVAMLVGVLAVAQPPAVAGAAPPYTIEERAAAIASPALVFIDLGFQGYLRDRTTGALLDEDAITVHRRCSGFVVSADGHVVAPTPCVQPSESSLRGSAAGALADRRIRDDALERSDRDEFVTEVRNTTNFTGAEPEERFALDRVTAQLFIATTDLDRATVIEGRILEALATDAGGIALLKLEATGLPVARLLPNAPVPGAPIVQVAFTVADPDGSSEYVVRSRAGVVTGRYGSEAPALYQVDGDLGTGSNGGMVVDSSGDVIGMITSASGRGNTILVGADQIRVLLTNTGVANTLTPVDEAYRAGLDAYFGGYYSDAIAALDTVLAQYPNHLPAQAYRTFASERLAIEGDPQPGIGIFAIIGIIVAVILALALVVLLVRWLRLRARARDLDEYGDLSAYPAMLPAAPAPRAIESGAPAPAPVSGAPVSAAPDLGWTPEWVPEGWAPPTPRSDATPAPPTTGPAPTADSPTSAPPQGPSAAWPAVSIWHSPKGGDPAVPPPAPGPADPAARPPGPPPVADQPPTPGQPFTPGQPLTPGQPPAPPQPPAPGQPPAPTEDPRPPQNP